MKSMSRYPILYRSIHFTNQTTTHNRVPTRYSVWFYLHELLNYLYTYQCIFLLIIKVYNAKFSQSEFCRTA